MKLTNVKTYVVKTDPPNWGGNLWFFVKLETDEGIVGWGETAVLGCLAGLEDSYESMMREIFARYLKGKDPIDREPLYHILYSSLTAQRIEAAVSREMEARGYVLSADPDLLVNFTVTLRNVQKVSTVPSAGPPAYRYRYGAYGGWPTYSYETWVREYEEGTLLIDLVDARRQQLVWEAAGTGRVTKAKLDNIEVTINEAVAALFERYPFRAGGTDVLIPPRS